MPGAMIQFGAAGPDDDPDPEKGVGNSVRKGIVQSNIDLLGQGKVLVRIPSLDREVWARLVAIGGGPGTGFFHPPNPDDEVLVAFDQGDSNQAYVLGGLWSLTDRPPVDAPVVNLTTRKYRTGLPKVPLGHEIEFDDAAQSVTILTSTKQKVTLDPLKIELSTTGGSVSVTLDLATQSVKISGPLRIELSSAGEISLSAARVSIAGTVQTDISGGVVSVSGQTLTNITGTLVKIN